MASSAPARCASSAARSRGAALVSAGSYASARAFTDGFAPAIGIAAALSLAGAIVGLLVPGLVLPGRWPVVEPAPVLSAPQPSARGG